jgi:HNH endonuclease
MSYVSESKREYIRQRAGNSCEYCLSQQKYVFGKFQIDHITPIAEGGADDDENLCLACEMCNQFKWAKIEGIDPQSGILAPLFNPRVDNWNDHFIWTAEGYEIIGLTNKGRATVDVLRMNNQIAVTVRKHWCTVGWHPPESKS